MVDTAGFLDTFLLAFFTFFATVSPINSLIIFMSLTGSYTSAERKSMAVKASLISSVVLFVVMLCGAVVLQFLGISMPALKTAGGLLLLLNAIGMMFGEDKESVDLSSASVKKDITVFPLSVPIIAGPAAITTSMLLVEKFNNIIILKGAVALALALNMIITVVLLLLSDKLIKKIKKSVTDVFLRIAGLILASLSVQFIFDGLKASGIFK